MAYTDSNWAADQIHCCSISGFYFKLADGTILWTSHTQKTVALSSTEAKYIALSDTGQQAYWFEQLLYELRYNMYPIPICGNNQGSIFITSNPVTEKHSK